MGRTIRIFISSTFKYFDKIRNELIGEVLPEIRDLCSRNGFSFRVVDLRWGITDDEGNVTLLTNSKINPIRNMTCNQSHQTSKSES